MNKYLNSIGTLLVVATFFCFLTPLVIGVTYSLHEENIRLESELNTFLSRILNSLESGMEEPILNLKPVQAQNEARLVISDPRVRRIKVYSSVHSMTLVNLNKISGKTDDPFLIKRRDIITNGEDIGYVQITIDKTFHDKKIAKAHRKIVILFAGMLVFGMALFCPIIYFIILKPGGKLMGQAKTLASGNLEVGSEWKGKDELSRLGNMLERMRQELKSSFTKIQRLAVTDELTQMPNRRSFFFDAEKALSLSQRYQRPLTIALMDIDLFKEINDNYGHDMGDEILKEVAAILMKATRGTDFCARYGGEEFVICMSETDISKARIVAEKLRKKIETYKFSHGQQVTFSVGIAENIPEKSLEKLIHEADLAMCKAKKAGRNKVVVYLNEKT